MVIAMTPEQRMRAADVRGKLHGYIRAATRAAIRLSSVRKISTRLSPSGTPALGTANSYDHASFSATGSPREAAARADAVGMIGSTEKYFGVTSLIGRNSTPCFQYRYKCMLAIIARVRCIVPLVFSTCGGHVAS